LKASPVAWTSPYGGLGISKSQFLIKQEHKISAVFFFFKTLDPYPEPDPYADPDSLEMLDPDPDSLKPCPQHSISQPQPNQEQKRRF
jgi:hypothetical protein